MEAETSRKISELAANLKKLHLAATMEEAYGRAKEIILGTDSDDKPIKDLMAEIKSEEAEIRSAEKEIGKVGKEAESAKRQLSDIQEQLKTDKVFHEARSGEIKDVKEDVKNIKKGADEIEDVVEEAEKVQQ